MERVIGTSQGRTTSLPVNVIPNPASPYGNIEYTQVKFSLIKMHTFLILK